MWRKRKFGIGGVPGTSPPCLTAPGLLTLSAIFRRVKWLARLRHTAFVVADAGGDGFGGELNVRCSVVINLSVAYGSSINCC